MVQQKRNKDTICATVSPFIKDRVIEIVDQDGAFASMSDFVSYAVTKFITEYDVEHGKTHKKAKKGEILFDKDDNHVEHYIID